MIRFSFWDGFFSFFNFTDKRIDRLEFIRDDGENIKHDWLMVGKDLNTSFDILKQEVETKQRDL